MYFCTPAVFHARTIEQQTDSLDIADSTHVPWRGAKQPGTAKAITAEMPEPTTTLTRRTRFTTCHSSTTKTAAAPPAFSAPSPLPPENLVETLAGTEKCTIPSSAIAAALPFIPVTSLAPCGTPDGDADLLSAGDTGGCPNGRCSDWYTRVGVWAVAAPLADNVDGDRSPVDRRIMDGAGAVPAEAVVAVVAVAVVSKLTERVSILR